MIFVLGVCVVAIFVIADDNADDDGEVSRPVEI